MIYIEKSGVFSMHSVTGCNDSLCLVGQHPSESGGGGRNRLRVPVSPEPGRRVIFRRARLLNVRPSVLFIERASARGPLSHLFRVFLSFHEPRAPTSSSSRSRAAGRHARWNASSAVSWPSNVVQCAFFSSPASSASSLVQVSLSSAFIAYLYENTKAVLAR